MTCRKSEESPEYKVFQLSPEMKDPRRIMGMYSSIPISLEEAHEISDSYMSKECQDNINTRCDPKLLIE
jgi:hypothetical protein